MGKASRWFLSVLGLKKSDKSPLQNNNSYSSSPKPPTTKRRWSFVKSYREKDHHPHQNNSSSTAVNDADDTSVVDPNMHAIAVAAATAAVAEAAVAAAQAAAAVVRLTSNSGRNVNNNNNNNSNNSLAGGSIGIREELAAVRIQAAFRGCLARRALRALKGLVRLQALFRGHIERKKWAKRLQRFQAILGAQARARAGRAKISELTHSHSSQIHQPGPATPEKFEHGLRSRSTKHEHSSILRRNSLRSNSRIIGDYDKAHSERSWEQLGSAVKNGTPEDEKNDRVLEIDTGKPHIVAKGRNLFHSTQLAVASDQYSQSFTTSKDSTTHQTLPSPTSCEVQSLTPLKFSREVEEDSFCTANNSPQFYSATSSRGGNSKRSPFTPTKSNGSNSYLSGYSDYPNYMACTQSSKAKLRSLSAPKQRPYHERSSSTKRYSVHGFGESKSNAQRSSTLHSNFTNKAYPGSGRLDKFGMPLGYRY